MASLPKRSTCAFIAFTLALTLFPLSASWADESILPPEGDSIESPFSPDGYLEDYDPGLDGFKTLGISGSSYQRLMEFAERYKGWEYIWGGRYPSQGGFDCCGLVMDVYSNVFGCKFDKMYTNAERLYNNHCTYVPEGGAQPGDLVFWRGTYESINKISHVSIYCGNGIVYGAGDPIGYYKINAPKNIYGRTADYFFASLKGVDEGYFEEPSYIPPDSKPMYRLYNPYSGEHFYTSNKDERANVVRAGWKYEGVGWFSPNSGANVYRLYNPFAGDHHYTLSESERDNLIRVGWRYEGVGWKSGGTVPVHRQYNPYAWVGTHNFTTNIDEHNNLVSLGWRGEGVAWYGVN